MLIHVEDLRVALVQAHQDGVGKMVADLLDLRPHARQRRQIGRLAAGEIDAVDVPVFIAALVLEVDDLPVVVGPEI